MTGHTPWSQISHKKPPWWQFRARLAKRRRIRAYRQQYKDYITSYVPPRHLMPRFPVDFNAGPWDVIQEGDQVVVFDGDGNECIAVIKELEFRNKNPHTGKKTVVVRCAMEKMDTWRDGPEEWAGLPHQDLDWRPHVINHKEKNDAQEEVNGGDAG